MSNSLDGFTSKGGRYSSVKHWLWKRSQFSIPTPSRPLEYDSVPSPIKRWGFVSPLLETGLALRLTLAKGGGSDDIPQGPLSLLDPCLSHEKRPGLSFWRLSGPAEHSRAASPQPTLEFTTHTLMSPSQMSPAQPRAMEPQYPCEQKKVFSVLCHWIYAALLWQQTTETTGCVVLSHILWLNITQMQKAE